MLMDIANVNFAEYGGFGHGSFRVTAVANGHLITRFY